MQAKSLRSEPNHIVHSLVDCWLRVHDSKLNLSKNNLNIVIEKTNTLYFIVGRHIWLKKVFLLLYDVLCCDLKQLKHFATWKYYKKYIFKFTSIVNKFYFHSNANNQYNENPIYNRINNEIIDIIISYDAKNISEYHDNNFVSFKMFPSNCHQNRIR